LIEPRIVGPQIRVHSRFVPTVRPVAAIDQHMSDAEASYLSKGDFHYGTAVNGDSCYRTSR
jgi:hypothetical protein